MQYQEPMLDHGHKRADARHLLLHRLALEKLRQHPELRAPVLELLDRWLADVSLRPSHRWLAQWREMLTSWPFDRLAEAVLDQKDGQTLRQCSPLGPVLSPRERWAALAKWERRHQ